MSRLATSFALGFHGCDRAVGERALKGELELIQSERAYDWLGPGVYFWENDPVRAHEWAQSKVRRGDYEKAFVIGAVIDLGNCLDLLVRENLDLLRWAYQDLKALREADGGPMPVNKDLKVGRQGDKLLRYLNCAVITHLHGIIDDQPDGGYPDIGLYIEPFDTVRGLFVEGDEVYPGGGFSELTHTQIAVRNPRMLKGLFIPR